MKIDFEGLKDWLLTLEADDFRNGIKIKHCSCQNEIDRQEKRSGLKHPYIEKVIIPNGGYHLVDIIGNDLTVVKTARKKYKTPSGRLVSRKIIYTVIEDCTKIYGTPLNGYWEIPKKFFIKE